jgi:hypothetical protein
VNGAIDENRAVIVAAGVQPTSGGLVPPAAHLLLMHDASAISIRTKSALIVGRQQFIRLKKVFRFP